jgi:hypothetical protein
VKQDFNVRENSSRREFLLRQKINVNLVTQGKAGVYVKRELNVRQDFDVKWKFNVK